MADTPKRPALHELPREDLMTLARMAIRQVAKTADKGRPEADFDGRVIEIMNESVRNFPPGSITL